MQSYKIKATLLLSSIAIFSQFFQISYAQEDIDIGIGIELSLIYPESVIAGEEFHIYASIYNGSSKTLLYPTIAHPTWTENGYSYLSCVKDCQPQFEIQPGDTRVIPAGVFYNSADTLQSGQLLIDDLKLVSVLSGTSILTETSFESVTVDVQLADTNGQTTIANPLLYPIPDRRALQIKDLAVSGDEMLIHDPNTGYDWLSPDKTRQMKISELMTAIAVDGKYTGFSIARASQVEALIMTQIHAAGIAAQVNDLRPYAAARLHDMINDTVNFLHPANADGSPGSGIGMVADKGLSFNTAPHTISTLLFNAVTAPQSDCGCASGGLSWRDATLDPSDDREQFFGAWLVRGATTPERPENIPSLFDSELLVPDVVVDGSHFQAILRLTDEKNLVLFLAELTAITAGSNSVSFENDSASITIPELEVINNDGSRSRVRVVLEAVPDTMPQAFTARILPPA